MNHEYKKTFRCEGSAEGSTEPSPVNRYGLVADREIEEDSDASEMENKEPMRNMITRVGSKNQWDSPPKRAAVGNIAALFGLVADVAFIGGSGEKSATAIVDGELASID